MCRFIILVGESHGEMGSGPSAIPDAALSTMGMDLRFQSHTIRIFVSSDTHTLSIPGRGLIIGHLFSKSGQHLDGVLDLDNQEDQLSRYLLDHFWGEYIAIDVSSGSKQVHVLRDPSGGIPCIYALVDRAAFITSDISIACNLGLYRHQIDWKTIAHGISYPHLRTGHTGLLGVNELLPGCYLKYENGSLTMHVAWSPWHFVGKRIRHQDLHASAGEVRSAVSTAVKAWAEVDRNVVLELSGGLDSSIVAASLRDTSARITYCTLVIPGAGVDERQYATLMTDFPDGNLEVLDVEVEDARFSFPLAAHTALPSIGILQNSVNDVWTTAGGTFDTRSFFSGGGGDSVFCYLRNAVPAVDAYKEQGIGGCLQAIDNLSKLHQCTFWKAARLTLKRLARQRHTGWKRDSSFLSASKVPEFPESHPWLDAPASALPGDREKILDLVGTQMFRDATPRGEGRAMRLPLLSQPVMEACLKVPTWMWIAGGQNRAVARAAFADVLPEGILSRRSKGTYTSYMSAIYMRNRDKMRQFLKEGRLTSHNLLDWEALDTFFDSNLIARDLSFVRIFDLCMAENWIRNQKL